VRHLEYDLAAIWVRGCDTVVMSHEQHSNTARLMGAAVARLGMRLVPSDPGAVRAR
jgi:1-aminocyclopropane-1-carboxylate deaminase/D-cysteine desulfhydrase-like pyridoxal-dependent ACC family enzyme